MDNIIAFSTVMLGLVTDFLAREPIIYLFALVCLIAVIKVFRQLMP